MEATAPRRAAEPEPGLCARRHCSTTAGKSADSALEFGVALQEIAQPLGHGEHPLPQRQVRQDVIGEMAAVATMRRALHEGRHRGPCRKTRSGSRARTVHTAPRKAVGEDAAVQIAAKLPLHVRRHRPVVVVALATLSEPGLEVLLDAAIEHAPALATRPIPRSCALPGLALDPQRVPCAAALQRWGSGWAARCAGRHWSQGLGRAAEVSWLNARGRRRIAGALASSMAAYRKIPRRHRPAACGR